MTLRDELAAVLGPGNNDAVAYEQADNVCEVLQKWIDLTWNQYVTPTDVLDILQDALASEGNHG